jgi:hypothetical protein
MLCEVDPLSRGRDLDVSILQLPFGPRGGGMGRFHHVLVSELLDGQAVADQGVGASRRLSASTGLLSCPPASDLRPRLLDRGADGPVTSVGRPESSSPYD